MRPPDCSIIATIVAAFTCAMTCVACSNCQPQSGADELGVTPFAVSDRASVEWTDGRSYRVDFARSLTQVSKFDDCIWLLERHLRNPQKRRAIAEQEFIDLVARNPVLVAAAFVAGARTGNVEMLKRLGARVPGDSTFSDAEFGKWLMEEYDHRYGFCIVRIEAGRDAVRIVYSFTSKTGEREGQDSISLVRVSVGWRLNET